MTLSQFLRYISACALIGVALAGMVIVMVNKTVENWQ